MNRLVRLGDDLYLRSVNGPPVAWYRTIVGVSVNAAASSRRSSGPAAAVIDTTLGSVVDRRQRREQHCTAE